MPESSESPEVFSAVQVRDLKCQQMLVSYVRSYSPTYLPPSIMSLNEFPSLFRMQASLCSSTGPHRIALFLHMDMIELLVSLYTSQKTESIASP